MTRWRFDIQVTSMPEGESMDDGDAQARSFLAFRCKKRLDDL